MGYGWPLFAAQFATLCNFYLSTWEEYHTGTLYLSAFSGPVEGIITVVALFFVTAYFGPGFWHAEITQFLPGVTATDVYLVVGCVGLGFNILSAAGNVFKSRRARKLQVRSAMTGVIPYVLFYFTLFVWVCFSPILIHTYLMLPFALTIGFSVALSVGRIITAHVTSQKFPITNVLMAYPTLAMLIQLVGTGLWGWDSTQTTTTLVWIGFGASFGVYGFFVAELITEITGYLDIYCLTIKHPKKLE